MSDRVWVLEIHDDDEPGSGGTALGVFTTPQRAEAWYAKEHPGVTFSEPVAGSRWWEAYRPSGSYLTIIDYALDAADGTPW